MAIQNFISGGFYGKVGQTVGQRWKNKRIIREYVIPLNPRTELQQSNREQFGVATKLAQEAYNQNKGSDLWDTKSNNQFSLMVGTAKKRLQEGKTPGEALPLYPDGYTPVINLNPDTIVFDAPNNQITIQDNSYTFEQTRTLKFAFMGVDCKTAETQILYQDITVEQNTKLNVNIPFPGYMVFPPGSNFQAATLNNADFGGTAIIIPDTPIEQIGIRTVTIQQNFEFEKGTEEVNQYTVWLDRIAKSTDDELSIETWVTLNPITNPNRTLYRTFSFNEKKTRWEHTFPDGFAYIIENSAIVEQDIQLMQTAINAYAKIYVHTDRIVFIPGE